MPRHTPAATPASKADASLSARGALLSPARRSPVAGASRLDPPRATCVDPRRLAAGGRASRASASSSGVPVPDARRGSPSARCGSAIDRGEPHGLPPLAQSSTASTAAWPGAASPWTATARCVASTARPSAHQDSQRGRPGSSAARRATRGIPARHANWARCNTSLKQYELARRVRGGRPHGARASCAPSRRRARRPRSSAAPRSVPPLPRRAVGKHVARPDQRCEKVNEVKCIRAPGPG